MKSGEEMDYPVTRTSEISYAHLIRGYPLVQLTGNITFPEATWLILQGELPTENEANMLEVLLTCGIDGGLASASVQAARVIATANPGNPMAAVVAALLSYGSVSGDPVYSARFINEVYDLMKKEGLSKEETAKRVVLRSRDSKQRIPGLGSSWYAKGDPRGIRIRECAERYGFVGEKTLLYDAISAELSEVMGKTMTPNIDGAFTVASLELGFRAELLAPLFSIGFIAGFLANVAEEIDEPNRRSIRYFIDNRIGWRYIGPERRNLPPERIRVPLIKTKTDEEEA